MKKETLMLILTVVYILYVGFAWLILYTIMIFNNGVWLNVSSWLLGGILLGASILLK